jgi:hypothetical protein
LNRSGDSPFGRVLHDLQERAKELACLYRVDEILSRPGLSTEEAVRAILAALPAGWQYPDACVARAVLGRRVFEPEDFRPTPWRQSAELEVHGQSLGRLEIYYTRELPGADESSWRPSPTGSRPTSRAGERSVNRPPGPRRRPQDGGSSSSS